jgi:hypothetical protein
VRVGDRHVAVEGFGLLLEPGQVLLVVRRVRDREEAAPAFVEAVGEEVVEDAAVGLAQDRVLRAVRGDLGDVVGEDPLQEGLGVLARGADLAHVGDVEEAGLGADGHVLLADALVLHGHLPSRERDQLGTERGVAVVQGRTAKGVGGGRGHGSGP